MEEKQGTGSSLSIPAILMALALAGGLIFRPMSLVSPRREGEARPNPEAGTLQQVPARLWEDPILVAERAGEGQSEANRIAPKNFPELRAQIQDDASDEANEGHQGLHIVAAMVPASPYAEEAETRIRARTAVISALAEAGYRPESDEHLGLVELLWPIDTSLRATPPPPGPLYLKPASTGAPSDAALSTVPIQSRRLAFERFRLRLFHPARPQAREHVLVIWLPDSLFRGSTLPRLAALVNALRGDLPLTVRRRIAISILGPYGSQMLREMVPWQNDSYDPRHSQLSTPSLAPLSAPQLNLENVRMFSWSATAMDDLLAHGFGDAISRAKIADYLYSQWKLQFQNTVATDDQLAAELIDELQLRGVQARKKHEHIALISEFDTFYGRNLPVAFAAETELRRREVLWHKTGGGAAKLTASEMVEVIRDFRVPDDEVTPWPAYRRTGNLHFYGYLRGIDGKTWRDKPTDKQQEKSSTEAAKEREREMDRAEGQNQLDYLPRLGDQIEARQREVQAYGEDLRAIGVLGSDFYDKVQILQALRPRFPRALFFTTDLDARYLHRDFAQWTRNLIIAAPFGFSLKPSLQREAAPFRSTMQTSLYYATLTALEGRDPTETDGRAPAPRRFELGRESAIDLSTLRSEFHPVRTYLSFNKATLCWIAAIVMAGWWLLVQAIPSFRNTLAPRGRCRSLAEKLRVREEDLFNAKGIQKGILRPPSSSLHKRYCAEIARLKKLPLSPQASKIVWNKPATAKEERQQKDFVASELADGPRHAILGALNEEIKEAAGGELSEEASVLLHGDDRAMLPRRCRNSPFVSATAFLKLLGSVWIGLWHKGERDRVRQMAAARLALEKQFEGHLRSCLPVCIGTARNYHSLYRLLFIGVPLFLLFVGWCLSLTRNPRGEPLSLLEGVSVWPTEALRVLVILLGLLFLFRAQSLLENNCNELAREFQLEWTFRRTLSEMLAKTPLKRSRTWRTFKALASRWRIGRAQILRKPLVWIRRAVRTTVRWNLWRVAHKLSVWNPQSGMPVIVGKQLWEEYRERGRTAARWMRLTSSSVIYGFFGTALFSLQPGARFFPIRGKHELWLDKGLVFADVLLLILLVFFVVDAARLCQLYVRSLSGRPTRWPQETFRHFARATGGMLHEDLDEWIDVQMIAKRTAVVGELIYYPFILISLMILARGHYLDAWDWPLALVIVLLCNAAWAVSAAALLQRTAREARESSLSRLEMKILAAQQTTGEVREKKLQELHTRIRELREGAFANRFDNPMFRSILLPFGSAGALQLVEFLLH